MERANRISRAQAVALPRPRATTDEWVVAAIAVALLLGALLGL